MSTTLQDLVERQKKKEQFAEAMYNIAQFFCYCERSEAIPLSPLRLLRGFAPRNDILRLFLQDTIL
jgi:hypothetical protein